MKRDLDKSATAEGGDAFLSRWSRRKEEARRAPPAEKAVDSEAPPPELPPVDKLTIDSDYRAFFHPKVDEDVRRSALKKLFGDPHFNVMDGLDVYIDDYSKTELIPPEMLAGLRQAQNILRWAREDTEEREEKERLARERLAQEPPSGSTEPAQALEPPVERPTPVVGVRTASSDLTSAPSLDAETPGKS